MVLTPAGSVFPLQYIHDWDQILLRGRSIRVVNAQNDQRYSNGTALQTLTTEQIYRRAEIKNTAGSIKSSTIRLGNVAEKTINSKKRKTKMLVAVDGI